MKKFLYVITCLFCISTAAFADATDDLFSAVREGNLTGVQQAVAAGAEIYATNEYDYTALTYAAKKGYLDIVKYLVEHGVDINSRDKDGDTALIMAADGGCLDIIEYLVEHGADVNAQDQDGETALISAVYEKNLEIVKYLVEHGADVNAQDQDGETALMKAVYKKNKEIVEYLVNAGADINISDHNGMAPIYYARENNNTEIIKILENAQLKNGVIGVARKLESIEQTFKRSHWKTASGNFNGARLASDSIAGVVLGTAGGLITSSVIKKNQTKHGFDDLNCSINGQMVAGYGDEFNVGIQ